MVSDAILTSTLSKVRVRFVCPEGYKAEFASSHCMLGVSVGQPKHESSQLLKTIQRVNREFNACTIMLADTLQRFNMKYSNPKLSWVKLHTLSKNEGDAWLARNESIINQLTIPHQIIRWDNWLNNPDYKFYRRLIDILYKESEAFSMAVFQTVQQLTLRFDKNNISLNCLNLFKYSIEYVKEECAVQLLLAKTHCNFMLYPGKPNPAMQYVYDFLIKSDPLNKFRWVDIQIDRR